MLYLRLQVPRGMNSFFPLPTDQKESRQKKENFGTINLSVRRMNKWKQRLR